MTYMVIGQKWVMLFAGKEKCIFTKLVKIIGLFLMRVKFVSHFLSYRLKFISFFFKLFSHAFFSSQFLLVIFPIDLFCLVLLWCFLPPSGLAFGETDTKLITGL